MRQSADALLVIINDILDFSKIEAGKLDLDAVDFSLRTMLDETLKPLALDGAPEGLELTARRRAGRARRAGRRPAPAAAGARQPGRQRDQVHRTRARSSSASDGTAVRLTATASSALRGRDTGIGIPADKQRGIFERVHAGRRLDDAALRRHRAGLTISAQLVELMGGRIWVESEPGTGSTFHFTVDAAG